MGRLTRIVENSVSTVFCYDGRGNVTRKLQTVGGTTDTTTYAYTLGNRLASIGYPSGNQVTYGCDANGRIQSVTLAPVGGGPSTVASAVSYLPFGPVASYTLGNGQTVTRTYDANYRATDVTSPALNLHFARNVMGDITALGNAPGANPAVETYSYDPLYHLTGVTGASSEAYTYNAAGDRLSKTGGALATGAYTYETGSHRLASVGSIARANDANGNTTGNVVAGEAFGFGYSDRNRMTVVQRGGQTVGTYGYNVFGQRVSKATSLPQSVTERYGYDQSGHLVSEYGTSNKEYVWLGSVPIAVVDIVGTQSKQSYVHADALGVPRALVDATGAIFWQWDYANNPFGEQAPTSTGYEFNLRFPGQYFDAESGLNYNHHRYYEPAMGRYLQHDPAGLSAGPNPYAYVSGRPMASIDPAGLASAGPPGEEDIEENLPEVNAEVARLDGEAAEAARAADTTQYAPRPDSSEWAPNGECKRPELAPPTARMSPPIHPGDVAGRTPAEIGAIADSLGLLRRGPDPENGKGSWLDPVTGQQRILSHPAEDHMHVNDPTGQRLDINGSPVDQNSPAAHLPIGK